MSRPVSDVVNGLPAEAREAMKSALSRADPRGSCWGLSLSALCAIAEIGADAALPLIRDAVRAETAEEIARDVHYWADEYLSGTSWYLAHRSIANKIHSRFGKEASGGI
jgi:hypothetical protein